MDESTFYKLVKEMIGFNQKKMKTYSPEQLSSFLNEFQDYSMKLWRENHILNQDLRNQKCIEEEIKSINQDLLLKLTEKEEIQFDWQMTQSVVDLISKALILVFKEIGVQTLTEISTKSEVLSKILLELGESLSELNKETLVFI